VISNRHIDSANPWATATRLAARNARAQDAADRISAKAEA
jgi:hypothetical protein